jgi:hypothetical protein
MKRKLIMLAALTVLFLVGAAQINPMAQGRPPKVEFIDIRWDGQDRMCVVYPDGRVDFFGKELKDIQRPDDVNKRAFYLTIEMNRLAAQGYEFVAMISDEIVMKRTLLN